MTISDQKYQLIDDSETARLQRAQTLLDVANDFRPSPESSLYALVASARRYGGEGIEGIMNHLRQLAEDELKDIDKNDPRLYMEPLIVDEPEATDEERVRTYSDMTIAEMRQEIAARGLAAPNARASHKEIVAALEAHDSARRASGETLED
tara:strand:- start:95 stop:547 length:453 start_codon:yes stop_codon:yes gene_type:complete